MCWVVGRCARAWAPRYGVMALRRESGRMREAQAMVAGRFACVRDEHVSNGARRFLSSYPDHTLVPMPALSPTMQAGTIAAWMKKEGDEVSSGDVLAQIETDKATVDFEAQDEGFLAKVLVAAGIPDIPVGKTVAIMVDDQSSVAAFAEYQDATAEGNSVTSSTGSAAPLESDASGAAKSSDGHGMARAGPYKGPIGPAVAYQLALHPEIDIDLIIPSGPQGRILKGDVLLAVENGTAVKGKSEPAPPAPQTTSEEPNASKKTGAATTSKTAAPAPERKKQPAQSSDGPSFIERAVSEAKSMSAELLLASKTTIPHTFLSSDYSLDRLESMLREMNKNGADVSVRDFVVKAAAMALRRVPGVLAAGLASNVDVDIAILSKENALGFAALHDADHKGVAEIGAKLKELFALEAGHSVSPSSSFAVNTLAMQETTASGPILLSPQRAVLTVGTGCMRMVASSGGGPESMFRAERFGVASLCVDARHISNAKAAAFLATFCKFMSNPVSMLL
ncbi:Dihydrolipoyllysine-residue acetyltransferase component 3 [Porphyridium purpureum]|uniref:Dihydrolipoamide acetyltransferase component of pyruvate dehydrogenase complex n=1 Tax=Porphyridium purpureum TaxID=35688 RepID=A0A5J4Z1X6_PORPP|nr:Dihydrolipoyllysine-residue acetyltransferase component 3 [Porphyridium purpureum]|eukprot:POR2330..scf295_1